MAKKENRNASNTYRIYIRSLSLWVEVPEEYYLEHVRSHDAFRHKMQARGLCSCPRGKWWICDMDCLTCEFYNRDVPISLDSTAEDVDGELYLKGIISDKGKDVADLVCDEMVSKQLFERLVILMPEVMWKLGLRLFVLKKVFLKVIVLMKTVTIFILKDLFILI